MKDKLMNCQKDVCFNICAHDQVCTVKQRMDDWFPMYMYIENIVMRCPNCKF